MEETHTSISQRLKNSNKSPTSTPIGNYSGKYAQQVFSTISASKTKTFGKGENSQGEENHSLENEVNDRKEGVIEKNLEQE